MRTLILGAALVCAATGTLACQGDVSSSESARARAAERTEPTSGGTVDTFDVVDEGERARAAQRVEAPPPGVEGLFDGQLAEPLEAQLDVQEDTADKVTKIADDLDQEADKVLELANEESYDPGDMQVKLEEVARLADELNLELTRLDAAQDEAQ